MSSTARVGPVRSEESPGSLIFTAKKRGGVPTWVTVSKLLGPACPQQSSNLSVAPIGGFLEGRAAALWPRTSRGAAPGGAHETVSPRPENRHTAPGALPLPEEPGPLPVGASLGRLWGGAYVFWP